MKNGTSRNAAEDTFLCCEAVSSIGGFFVGNCDYTIDHVSVQDIGNEPGANPLNVMHTGFAAGQHGRVRRFHHEKLHIRDFLFQNLTCASGGTSRTDSNDQRIESAVDDMQDFP